MLIVIFLVLGMAVGGLTRLLVPGGKEPGGWLAFVLIGVGGALLGGFLGRAIGRFLPVGEDPAQPAAFVMSLMGAGAFVALYLVIARRRKAEKPGGIAGPLS